MQGEALNILLEEGLNDVCVIIYSFNGSGKTLSFLIPVLNSIDPLIPHSTYKPGKQQEKFIIAQPQAVIVVPTEALQEQTFSYLK